MEIIKTAIETKMLGVVEVEVNSVVDTNGMIISTVSHDSLQSLVTENRLTYEFKVIVCEKSHTLIECKMADADNHMVIGIGESTEGSLDTPIAQNYPSLMAYKRAFDAAALDIFGFPPRFYGDSSGILGGNSGTTVLETPAPFKAEDKKAEKKSAAKTQKKTGSKTSTSVVEEMPVKEEPVVSAEEQETPVEDVTAIAETEADSKLDAGLVEEEKTLVEEAAEEAIEVTVEEPEPEPEQEAEPEPEPVSEVEMLANEEITFARKIAGKTFAEIAKTTNSKWLNWALTQYNPTQPDILENLMKFRRYCELIGVKGSEE